MYIQINVRYGNEWEFLLITSQYGMYSLILLNGERYFYGKNIG